MTGIYDLEEVYPCKIGNPTRKNILSEEVVICSLTKCPYGNGSTINWELESSMLCKSGGLIISKDLISIIELPLFANDNQPRGPQNQPLS